MSRRWGAVTRGGTCRFRKRPHSGTRPGTTGLSLGWKPHGDRADPPWGSGRLRRWERQGHSAREGPRNRGANVEGCTGTHTCTHGHQEAGMTMPTHPRTGAHCPGPVSVCRPHPRVTLVTPSVFIRPVVVPTSLRHIHLESLHLQSVRIPVFLLCVSVWTHRSLALCREKGCLRECAASLCSPHPTLLSPHIQLPPSVICSQLHIQLFPLHSLRVSVTVALCLSLSAFLSVCLYLGRLTSLF